MARLSQPDARPSAVFVDEHDAGRFEGSPDHVHCGAAWLSRSGLQLMNRNCPDPGIFG